MSCFNAFNDFYFKYFDKLVSDCRDKNNTNMMQNYKRVKVSIQKYPFPIVTIQQALSLNGVGEAISRTFEKLINNYKTKIIEEEINYINLAYKINPLKNSKKYGNKKKAESEGTTDVNLFIKKKPLRNVEAFSGEWTAVISLYLIYLQNKKINIEFDEVLSMALAIYEELKDKNILIQMCDIKHIKDLKNRSIIDKLEEKSNGIAVIKINETLIKMAKIEILKHRIELEIDDEGTINFSILPNSNNNSQNESIKTTQDLNSLLNSKNYSSNVNNINHVSKVLEIKNFDTSTGNVSKNTISNFLILDRNKNVNSPSNKLEYFLEKSLKERIYSTQNLNKITADNSNPNGNNLANLDYNDYDFNSDFSSNEDFYTKKYNSSSISPANNILSVYNYFKSENNLKSITENSESNINVTQNKISYFEHENINNYDIYENYDDDYYYNNEENKFDSSSFKKNYEFLNKLIESSKKSENYLDLSLIKKNKNSSTPDRNKSEVSSSNSKSKDQTKNFLTQIMNETPCKIKNNNGEKINRQNNFKTQDYEIKIKNNNRDYIEFHNKSKNKEKADYYTRNYKFFLKSLNNKSYNNISSEEDFESFSLNIKLVVDNRERGPKGEKIPYELRSVNPEILCEERVLAVGDLMWIYTDPHTDIEYVLDYVIERKTLADLASSIKDGRYVEQKHRLKNTKLTNVFYLFEGTTFNSTYTAISKSAVYKAMWNTFNIHDIRIIKTFTFEDTLEFIDKMDNFIRHLYFINKEDLNLLEMITFQDFLIKNAKTKHLSEENIFLKQIRCVIKIFKFIILLLIKN